MNARKKTAIRAAVSQFAVNSRVAQNLEIIRADIVAAANARADVVVFPECALSGYAPLQIGSPADIDFDELAVARDELCKTAAGAGINVIIGTTEKAKNGFFNTALVIDRRGRITGRYVKKNLTASDVQHYSPGREIGITRIDGVPVGVAVCYDVRFPEYYRRLAELNVRAVFTILQVLSPDGRDRWKRNVLEAHLISRAAENSFFTVASNAANRVQCLRSLIADPNGIVLAAAPFGRRALIIADLDTDKCLTSYMAPELARMKRKKRKG